MMGTAKQQSSAQPTARELQAAIIALKGEIGPTAQIYVRISEERREKPLSASIYTMGIGRQNGPTFTVNAETFAEILTALRDGWAEFQVEHARRMTADLALEIIRITDEQGECTDAALRGARFNVVDVAKYGAAACAKANEMAGRGPFTIVSIAGANGRAA